MPYDPADHLTDAELLALIERARHDPAATDHLIAIFHNRVASAIRCLEPRATRQDLLEAQSDLVSHLWIACHTLASKRWPWAYLSMTIHNGVRDFFAELSARRARLEPSGNTEPQCLNPGPEDLAINQDFETRLRAWRDRLPASQHEAFDVLVAASRKGISRAEYYRIYYHDDHTAANRMERRIARLRQHLRHLPPGRKEAPR